MSTTACFITLEGGEGAGKSTQLKWLVAAFEAAGLAHLCTREPGGCPSAEQIRSLLVSGEADRWLPQSEALLMMAARFEHVKRRIEPALEQDKWVLCDRFFDSTIVYQGGGKGLGASWLHQLYRLLFGQFRPQLTLYFDIDPEQGLARTQSRNGAEARFESLPLSFHQQVREGFLALAKQDTQRIAMIDASQTMQQVHEAVVEIVNKRFALALSPSEGAPDGR